MSERDGEKTEKKELFGCADVVKWFGRKLVLTTRAFSCRTGSGGNLRIERFGKDDAVEILAGWTGISRELSKTD
ncbi:MAG: hypothetical protein ACLRSW_11550 [Christensenellaceae bacterium]